jgi:hypothetical protein
MKRALGTLLAAACCLAAEVRFNRDIRPILSDRCFACHGPDKGNRKSALRLDIEADAKSDLGGGRRGIVEGDPERSTLIQRVTSANTALRMPPAYLGHDRLPESQIALLRTWISEGAKYESHWSFVAPVRPALPVVQRHDWVCNPIDRFVLARLEKEGLSPSPPASKTRLLRRVTLDLTGLAPEPDQVTAFLSDNSPRNGMSPFSPIVEAAASAQGGQGSRGCSPQAYERVVDKLLASPRYAERMAIRWLEAARYADTNGYQTDGPRDMWRWRDWVIHAFHSNMPFDRFTVEQIAGDLLPGSTLDQKIATAFHRNHRTSAEGGIVDEEFRVEYVADRTETTSIVWLGATLGCARCHDHKYDPFTQKEYYSLFAFFNNVPEKGFVYNFGNEEPYIKAPLPEQATRLAELDAAVERARHRVDALRGLADKEQRKWEKDLHRNGVSDCPLNGMSPFRPIIEAAASAQGGKGSRGCWAPKESLAIRVDETKEFDGNQVHEAAPATSTRLDYRDPFTFSAWIEPREKTGAILSKAEDYFEGTGHGLYLIDGKLRLHVVFRWTDLGLRVETLNPLKTGARHHVAVTYDGSMKASGVRMYVNGQEQKLKILFDQCLWPLNPKEPWRIGAGGGLRFQGRIGGVRVWTRVLAANEIAAVALDTPLDQLAKIKQDRRTQDQREKLRLAFLDLAPPARLRDARDALETARRKRDEFCATIPTVMVMAERAERRPTYLLKRGAYDAPGDPVEPGVPALLGGWKQEWPRNRLGLARWVVSRDNPLTARVTVNRLWEMLFGTGLVKTVEDFGSQGEWPLHQELLDWLSVEFIESGWDVKHILKTIVMSATYQQSSDATAALHERDPENRWLARGPRLRLAPEMVRDQALQASGLLVEKLGGPSVKPYQPPGLWKELQSGADYQPDRGESLYRRSLYTYWRRTVAPPSMITFDSPSREVCVVRQTRTNTPMQALDLMNNVTYVEAARKLGERMIKSHSQRDARLRYGWSLVLGRDPAHSELASLEAALLKFASYYGNKPDEAERYLSIGASPRDSTIPPAELAAYAAVSSLMLNLDETVTKE